MTSGGLKSFFKKFHAVLNCTSGQQPALTLHSVNLLCSVLFTVLSAQFFPSPEDPFCLVSIETQNFFRKTSLNPGQLAVWISFLLKCHHLFQGGAEHGGTENCIPCMLDLLQTRLLQALENKTHTK